MVQGKVGLLLAIEQIEAVVEPVDLGETLYAISRMSSREAADRSKEAVRVKKKEMS